MRTRLKEVEQVTTTQESQELPKEEHDEIGAPFYLGTHGGMTGDREKLYWQIDAKRRSDTPQTLLATPQMKTRITQEIFFDTESSRRARGSLYCHPMTFVGTVDVVDVVDPA